MTREEAIEQIYTRISKEMAYKEQFYSVIEALERLKEPITLAEFLGWEEGIEYEELYGDRFIIKDNSLYKTYYANLDIKYEIPRIAEFDWSSGNIEWLRQAKKVELKPKAWIVRDEYSYKCLIMELEEQGYTKAPHSRGYSPVFPIIYINYDGEYSEAQFGSTIAKTYNIVDYHKEPPRFYAKIKGWELTKDGDCYWYKDENPIHGIYPWSEEEASIYTKEEWAKLGITEENADFEEIKGG